MVADDQVLGARVVRPTNETRQVADAAAADGRDPLTYMLSVLADPKAAPNRRDEMARSAAHFCHPRLNAVAAVGMPANSCSTLEVQIFSVPRGATIDPKTGLITCPDGSPGEAGPFTPYQATPGYDALPAPAVDIPAEDIVTVEVTATEDDPKIVPLRRSLD